MGHYQINPKHCVNSYKNAACNLCEQSCPQQAIANHEIDSANCNDCGLCLSVCPTRSVESAISYQKYLSDMSIAKVILFRCRNRDKISDFPCLGFLDSRVLWAFAQDHRVILDLHYCSQCNLVVSKTIRQNVAVCNDVLQQEGKELVEIDSPIECISKQAERINRRDFFKQMFQATLDTVDIITTNHVEENYVAYRPEAIINQQIEKRNLKLNNKLFYSIIINQNCNACGLCAKICPQQALQGTSNENHFVLKYHTAFCYNCKVCEYNCPTNAIKAASLEGTSLTEYSIRLPLCTCCSKPFQPIGKSKICLDCYKEAGDSS